MLPKMILIILLLFSSITSAMDMDVFQDIIGQVRSMLMNLMPPNNF